VSAGDHEQSKGGGLSRLPPGRHGLPREFVVENQRGRIAAGMIEVVVERGYVAASVTQVVAAAGVSRRTFYNYYSDKAEAFFDVYAQVTDFLIETMAEAGGGAKRGWPATVRRRVDALLGCFSENPDLVRFTLQVPQAAGGDVAVAYRTFLERLLESIGAGRPKRVKTPPPAAEYGVVGGLAALIVEALDQRGEQAIATLAPDATELILTPYLGRDAVIEATRPAS
jgi:AcrR family transcriptional regulator